MILLKLFPAMKENFSLTFLVLLVVLTLTSGRVKVPMVVAITQCQEILDDCVTSDDCNARCTAKHPGGEGSCYPFYKPSYCTCYYNCGPPEPPPPPPPPPRNCSTILDDCVTSDDCEARCVALHPGGEGSCYPFYKPSYCTCYYNCVTMPLPENNYDGGAGGFEGGSRGDLKLG